MDALLHHAHAVHLVDDLRTREDDIQVVLVVDEDVLTHIAHLNTILSHEEVAGVSRVGLPVEIHQSSIVFLVGTFVENKGATFGHFHF